MLDIGDEAGESMRRVTLLYLLPLWLLLGTCKNPTVIDLPLISDNHDLETRTIPWEKDGEGFIQFYTNDVQNADVSFAVWHGSRCDPWVPLKQRSKRSSGASWEHLA
jgi:hypothetical protein